MSDTTFLCCSRIRLSAVPGRTENFAAALCSFLETIAGRAEAFSYAELQLTADENESVFYWMGDEQPDLGDCLSAVSSAAELDISLNLCSEEDCASDALNALTGLLSDGSYADCARVCTLTRDGDDTRVFLSGMREGAFHHGEIPFGNDAAPDGMCWNSCTHSAHFTFSGDACNDAWDLSDLLAERIDEIDLEFSYDDGTLAIHSVQLPDAENTEVYRAALEQFCAIADSASIDGVLTPEAENAFALMRLVLSDGHVSIRTAIAEI